MARRFPGWVLLLAISLVLSAAAACAPAAPAPAPTKAAAPSAPTAAPTKGPEATKAAPAPTKAPEAAPKKIDYPTKPVTFSVQSPAGGSTDVGMRLLMAAAEKHLGQPIPVVNNAGAGGLQHYTQLARAKPDGYYIGVFLSPQTIAMMLDAERAVGFGMGDFEFIVNHVFDPNVIAVRADSPFKTWEDVAKAAKEQPGKISAGVTAKLGDDHLIMVDIMKRTGLKFNIVHFDGSAPNRAAVLGGHVQLYVGNQGDTATQVKNGEFRALAVASDKRSPLFPDTPTLTELGLPIIGASARGIAAPKGTPKEIVQILEAAFRKAVEDPDHVKKMDEMGLPLRFMGSAEYSKFLEEEYKKYEVLIPEAAKAIQ